MEIVGLKISGTFEITLAPRIDDRGFFMRTFDSEIFKETGMGRQWVQENQSLSFCKGTIRGLHYQFPPYSETKLVRCINGCIMDVFVDLRKGSPTFGQWDSIELSSANKKMVFIPRGLAHGFCTLTEMSEVLYKTDNYYSPKHEGGLLWNDSDIGIPWHVSEPVISQKDQMNLSLKQFIEKYKALTL
jgi:dTDP-4-dehydrorhamnose 3,5-epimerase